MRVLVAIVLAPAGAATALATVALHQLWWGFLLGSVATAATLWALGGGWTTRLPFGVGWTALVAWVLPPRAEGDYVVGSDPAGYALMAFALLVLGFSIATLPRPRASRELA